MTPAQIQAYLIWRYSGPPLGSQGDAYLGGPLIDYGGILFWVSTIAELRAFEIPSLTIPVLVIGYALAGDVPPSIYLWNPTDATDDNGGTVIKPNAVSGSGRWNLVGTIS